MSTLTVYAATASEGHLRNNEFTTPYASAQGGTGYVSNGNFQQEVGQGYSDPNYLIYRTGLSFDTSTLGVGTTISAATLSIYGWSDFSDTDFNLTVVSGTDLANTLLDADFQELLNDTTSFGATSTSGFAEGAYFDISLNATGIAAISLTGTTRFGLRSSRDISTTTPTGLESIQYETPDTTTWPAAHAPKLTITYYGSLVKGNIAWSGNYLVGIDHNGNRRQILGDIY